MRTRQFVAMQLASLRAMPPEQDGRDDAIARCEKELESLGPDEAGHFAGDPCKGCRESLDDANSVLTRTQLDLVNVTTERDDLERLVQSLRADLAKAKAKPAAVKSTAKKAAVAKPKAKR